MTPAVDSNDPCRINNGLLATRVAVLALPILVGYIMAPPVVAVIAAYRIALLLIPVVKWFDRYLAERSADQNAVNEYLNSPVPSKSSAFRIQHRLQAAQLLIDRKGDVNKRHANGPLIEDVFSIKIFELLINNGANIKALNRFKEPIFHEIVSTEPYLKIALQSGKIQPSDFTSDEQVGIWLKVQSLGAGQLLKQHGFDVNSRNSKGETPLLNLVNQVRHSTVAQYVIIQSGSGLLKLAVDDKMKKPTRDLLDILLKCGADPTVVSTSDDDKNNDWFKEIEPILMQATLEWQTNQLIYSG